MLFKPPTEKDLPDGKMSPNAKVRALFSLQWNFYRDSYYKLLLVAGIQLVIILVLAIALGVIGYVGTPPPKYFARNALNQIVELYPLNKPRYGDEQVRQFVTDAVLESMNFTFDDYKYRLQKAAPYFTDRGFAEWDNALRRARVYDQLEEKQLLMRTTLVQVPSIDKNASKVWASTGRYMWVVDVDVMRTLSDRAASKSTPYRYKVFVQQKPYTERSSGLAIYSVREEAAGTR